MTPQDLRPLDLRPIVGVAMIALLGLALAALFFVHIPTENRDLAIALISGVIGASAKDVVGYYFGGSKGSSDKDATIAAMASPTDPNPPQGAQTGA